MQSAWNIQTESNQFAPLHRLGGENEGDNSYRNNIRILHPFDS